LIESLAPALCAGCRDRRLTPEALRLTGNASGRLPSAAGPKSPTISGLPIAAVDFDDLSSLPPTPSPTCCSGSASAGPMCWRRGPGLSRLQQDIPLCSFMSTALGQVGDPRTRRSETHHTDRTPAPNSSRQPCRHAESVVVSFCHASANFLINGHEKASLPASGRPLPAAHSARTSDDPFSLNPPTIRRIAAGRATPEQAGDPGGRQVLLDWLPTHQDPRAHLVCPTTIQMWSGASAAEHCRELLQQSPGTCGGGA
jgi:hypothetical protein